jgi:DNA-binding IclR family transcriptional regulator
VRHVLYMAHYSRKRLASWTGRVLQDDGMMTTSIKILDKTVRLLSVFSSEQPEWGLSELSVAVAIPKSTTHRILRVLTQHEYLAQDAITGRFRLGLAALELGFRAHAGIELRRVALPVLQHLTAVSRETVLLIVPSATRTEAVCVERTESREGLQLILDVGRHVPLHAGASSKVLLAYMTEKEIERVVARGLARVGPRTITDVLLLRRDLATTRRRGYAWSVEETNEGVAGVAVPLFDRSGQIAAGLSVVGPRGRFTTQRVPWLLALIRDGATDIARRSGLTTLRPLSGTPAAAEAPLRAPNGTRATGGATRRRPRR